MVDHDSDTDWDSDLDEMPANASARPAKDREAMTERTPLIPRDAPPPAYADVTRNDAPSSVSGGNEQPASEPVIHNERPQNVSDGPGDPESGNKVQKRRWMNPKSLFVLGMILLASIIVVSIIGAKHGRSGSDENGGGNGSGSGDDDGGGKEKIPTPPYDTSPGIPHRSDCPSGKFSEPEWFEFANLESFSLKEVTEKFAHFTGGVNGQVRVQLSSEEQPSAILVSVKYASSGIQMSRLDVQVTSDSLQLGVPHVSSRTGSYSCIDIEVTMFIRPDISLSNFAISTQSLGIKIEGNLFTLDDSSFHSSASLQVTNSTHLHTISGNVNVAYWSSRETYVDLVSGSIHGHFALRDVLSLRTHSGSIDASVFPKKADAHKPKPAAFTALTTSGSIRTHFPLSGSEAEIPERVYTTHVETTSGSVSGDYILGTSGIFVTKSGGISVTILPYAADTRAVLRTETYGGHIATEVLEPFRDPEMGIGRLQSYHKATSASMTLRYPKQWTGGIEGQTVNGGLSLRGKDVHISRSYHGPVGYHVVAKKGTGHSKIDMATTSGSIDAVVGELY